MSLRATAAAAALVLLAASSVSGDGGDFSFNGVVNSLSACASGGGKVVGIALDASSAVTDELFTSAQQQVCIGSQCELHTTHIWPPAVYLK